MDIYVPDSERIIHKTSADFVKRIVTKPVNITQYDSSLPIIEVSTFLNGKPYTLPENSNVNVKFSTHDRNFVYNPALGWNEDRTAVYLEVSPAMTTGYGHFVAIIEIMIGTKVAGSSYIEIYIARNPIQNEDIKSNSEFIVLEDYSKRAEEAAEEAGLSADRASVSEANAEISAENAYQAYEDTIYYVENNLVEISPAPVTEAKLWVKDESDVIAFNSFYEKEEVDALLDTKVDSPETEGIPGQVLGLSEDGKTIWKDSSDGVQEQIDEINKKIPLIASESNKLTTENSFKTINGNNIVGYGDIHIESVPQDLLDRVDTLEESVDNIEEVIPTDATGTNVLATEDFVNSSIATNTSYFMGSFDSLEELEATSPSNNDYGFVKIGSITLPDGTTLEFENALPNQSNYNLAVEKGYTGTFEQFQEDLKVVRFDRYKYNSKNQEWGYEWAVNNSSFTDEQWKAINSGINVEDVTKFKGYESKIDGKLDKVTTASSYRRVYAIDRNGSQMSFNLVDPDTDIVANGVVLRSNGYISCKTPSKGIHTANKQYVDDAISEVDGKLDNKLDKYTGSSNTLYGATSTGQTNHVLYSSNTLAGSIVQRDTNGRFSVSRPTTDSEAANKKYVDDSIPTLKTINGNSIKGEGDLPVIDANNPDAIINIESKIGELYTAEEVDEIVDGVNTELGKKLNRTNYNDVVYAHTTEDTVLQYSAKANAYTIARRVADGALAVGTPISDAHATTKKYVDDLIEGISSGVTDVTVDDISIVEDGVANLDTIQTEEMEADELEIGDGLEVVDGKLNAKNVKINGVETSDNNIPIANASQLGVIRYSSTYGMQSMSGTIAPLTWTTYALNRQNAFASTTHIDYYTKLALTAPVADDTHPSGTKFPNANEQTNVYIGAWTDADKTRAWQRLSTIKNSLDSVCVPNASYFIGEQSSVSITLPDTAEVGQMVVVCWYNGETAAEVSIENDHMLEYDYIPSPNTRSEINALWDGQYWSVIGYETEVPA